MVDPFLVSQRLISMAVGWHRVMVDPLLVSQRLISMAVGRRLTSFELPHLCSFHPAKLGEGKNLHKSTPKTFF